MIRMNGEKLKDKKVIQVLVLFVNKSCDIATHITMNKVRSS
jgi:hypothetical protein